ncbi:hypothetical protein FXO38_14635 [Capsicum annuum]|nr:hypothetical protein FXO38_14635 [Capsicum annuum]
MQGSHMSRLHFCQRNGILMYWHVSVSILFGLNWPWDRMKISLSVAAKVEAEAAVGNAIYMLPSFYNHDCDPNAHMLWIESVNTKVKVLRDIEAGEELRICYIDASMDHYAPAAILSEGFGLTEYIYRPLKYFTFPV